MNTRRKLFLLKNELKKSVRKFKRRWEKTTERKRATWLAKSDGTQEVSSVWGKGKWRKSATWLRESYENRLLLQDKLFQNTCVRKLHEFSRSTSSLCLGVNLPRPSCHMVSISLQSDYTVAKYIAFFPDRCSHQNPALNYYSKPSFNNSQLWKFYSCPALF
jgi:hypothetical protein